MKASSDGSGSMLRSASAMGLILLCFCGCGSTQRARILEESAHVGFERIVVEAGGFELTAFKRIEPGAKLLVVYIEGDGRAWHSKRLPSTDPTPDHPIALQLAATDPAATILYLARPCQFLTPQELSDCPQRFWTSHRYSAEVIVAMDTAIDRVIAGSGLDRESVVIGLVGFSGGGTVASLIAARRSDVVWLVTVAGNLDHAAWTNSHNVSPLTASLNAMDVAAQLAALPQVHLVGERDDIVPETMVQPFIDRLGENAPATLTRISGFDHHCCWHHRWPQIACESLRPLLANGSVWCNR